MRSISNSKYSGTNVRGILWALAAVALFSVIFVSGRLTGDLVHPIVIVWLRYVGAFLFLAPVSFSCSGMNIFSTNALPTHLFRVLAGGLGLLAAIYAASNMPVVNATAIGLLEGIFTVLLGSVLLKEVITARTWLAAFWCFVGAFIIVSANDIFDFNWFMALPIFAAMAGALLLAFEAIFLKRLAETENSSTVLFYVNFLGVILFGIPSFFLLEIELFSTYCLLLLVGPIALIGQLCNIQAFRCADVSIVGPIRYSWIIFGAGWGVIFFDESLSLYLVVGAIFILHGGYMLAVMKRPFKSS